MKAGFELNDDTEPVSLAAALTADLPTRGPKATAAIAAITAAHERNQKRRAAVLAHPDLCRRLVTELGYAEAWQWNGYIPPATVNYGSTEELCRKVGAGGQVRWNQLGRHAIGEIPNDSPRRVILLEISAEAYARTHAKGGVV